MIRAMSSRVAWIWAATMTLACAGLAVVAFGYAQDAAIRDARISRLEDQLAAYRALAEEQARWAEEWKHEKRELIRAQREEQASDSVAEPQRP